MKEVGKIQVKVGILNSNDKIIEKRMVHIEKGSHLEDLRELIKRDTALENFEFQDQEKDKEGNPISYSAISQADEHKYIINVEMHHYFVKETQMKEDTTVATKDVFAKVVLLKDGQVLSKIYNTKPNSSLDSLRNLAKDFVGSESFEFLILESDSDNIKNKNKITGDEDYTTLSIHDEKDIKINKDGTSVYYVKVKDAIIRVTVSLMEDGNEKEKDNLKMKNYDMQPDSSTLETLRGLVKDFAGSDDFDFFIQDKKENLVMIFRDDEKNRKINKKNSSYFVKIKDEFNEKMISATVTILDKKKEVIESESYTVEIGSTLDKLQNLESLKKFATKYVKASEIKFCTKNGSDYVAVNNEEQTKIKKGNCQFYIKTTKLSKENKELANDNTIKKIADAHDQFVKNNPVEKAVAPTPLKTKEDPKHTDPFADPGNMKDGLDGNDPSQTAINLSSEEWMHVLKSIDAFKGFEVKSDNTIQKLQTNSFKLKGGVSPKCEESFSILETAEQKVKIVYTEEENTFVQSQVLDVNVHAKCMLFTASFQMNKKNTNNTAKKETTLYMTGMYRFPRAILSVRNLIEPTEQFLKDVDQVINKEDATLDDLEEFVFKKYGNLFATKVTIGGQLTNTTTKTTSAESSESQITESYKASISAAYAGIGSVDAKVEKSIDEKTGEASLKTKDELALVCCGGEAFNLFNKIKWLTSLKKSANWKVIENNEIVFLHDLLDEPRRKKIIEILQPIVYEFYSEVDMQYSYRNKTTHENKNFRIVRRAFSLPHTGVDLYSAREGIPYLVQKFDRKEGRDICIGKIIVNNNNDSNPIGMVPLYLFNTNYLRISAYYSTNKQPKFPFWKLNETIIGYVIENESAKDIKRKFTCEEKFHAISWHGIGSDIYALSNRGVYQFSSYDMQHQVISTEKDIIQLAATATDIYYLNSNHKVFRYDSDDNDVKCWIEIGSNIQKLIEGGDQLIAIRCESQSNDVIRYDKIMKKWRNIDYKINRTKDNNLTTFDNYVIERIPSNHVLLFKMNSNPANEWIDVGCNVITMSSGGGRVVITNTLKEIFLASNLESKEWIKIGNCDENVVIVSTCSGIYKLHQKTVYKWEGYLKAYNDWKEPWTSVEWECDEIWGSGSTIFPIIRQGKYIRVLEC